MCLIELWFSQVVCLVVGLLGHIVASFLAFKGISILFSLMAVSVYIPTNSAGSFPFLHFFNVKIYCVCGFFFNTGNEF